MPGLKRSKGPPSSARKRYPNKPNTRHSRTLKNTTKPQQWLQGTPRPQQWFLLGVQVAVCEASNPPNTSNASKALATPNSARKRYPNRHHAQRCKQKPPQQVPDKATAMAQSRLLIMGVQGCRLPSLKTPKNFKCLSNFCHAIYYYRRSRLPFARPQRPKNAPQQLRPGPRGHSHLLLSAFEAAVCRTSEA